MIAVRRLLVVALVALGIVGGSAGPALAHAELLSSSPAANAHVKESNGPIVLRFSEAVQIVNRSDVTIVNERGVRVDNGTPHTDPSDPRRVIVGLSGPLVPASYTVRVRVVSDDSHAEAQAFVFGIGSAPLGSPVLAGAGGLSDTSPTSVAARVAELVALGLLFGLVAFRMLVWGPAVRRARGLTETERDGALEHGQRVFWRAFWSLVALAGVAEAIILASKSAVVFHKSLGGAVLHPDAAYRLVSASRFGDMLGWRSAALCALVAVAFVVWSGERAGTPTAGQRGAMAVMGLLGVAALTLLAAQGHASQAPLAPLSIAVDATHLGAVAIWIGGLPCLAAVLLRAPRALPESGRALASATLSRFSRVALWSVGIIAVTGFARMLGEVSSPAQLWNTDYGRSLILKGALLCPILVLAVRNRRLVASLADGFTPSAARLRVVARSVQMELTIAIAIIAVAALLVAQIPGRG